MNELVLVQNIEKKLREKREPVIFPLSPTHRKELRDLRNKNVGDLRDRLRIIRNLKEDEYNKKYSDTVEKQILSCKKICDTLNNDWIKRVDKLNEILSERKTFEKKFNTNFLNINHEYSTISKLETIKGESRSYSFNKDDVMKKILRQQFDEKYGKAFNEVSKRIDDVYTKYEEAINFGDLEIVKNLYYIMKCADGFFEKITKLEI